MMEKCQPTHFNLISHFGFFSVKTDLLKDGAISRLFIAFASKRDTGNYTCSMRNAQASVFVHILDGKQLHQITCRWFSFGICKYNRVINHMTSYNLSALIG